LDDLVTAPARAAFLEAFAAKTRWYFPQSRAEAAAALLPWPVIEGLIAEGAAPVERFRLALNGNDLPAVTFSDARGRAKPDAITGYMAQGATLVINDIAALNPAIGELTAEMERELRCAIGVNAYVTFGGRAAFSPHNDGHDVVILQIQGAKIWRSFGFPVAYPLNETRINPAPEQTWEGLLTPGDLLYLPRGEVHDTQVEARPSVHLTFGINETTGVDYLKWLTARARGVEVVRRDLGATLDSAARERRDRDLTGALQALLDGGTPAAFFADHDRRQPLRPLAPLNAAGRFKPQAALISAVRRRLDLAVEAPGAVTLTLGDRPLRLEPLARRALAHITAENRIRVVALAERLGVAAQDPALLACLEDLAAKALIAIGDCRFVQQQERLAEQYPEPHSRRPARADRGGAAGDPRVGPLTRLDKAWCRLGDSNT
jgi:hypothetical protein